MERVPPAVVAKMRCLTLLLAGLSVWAKVGFCVDYDDRDYEYYDDRPDAIDYKDPCKAGQSQYIALLLFHYFLVMLILRCARVYF